MTTRAFNSIEGFSVGENPAQDIILGNGDITTVNFTANGVSNLGPISNVKIIGGSTGQVVTTDGSGNLTFADATGGNSVAPMPYYIPPDKSFIVPVNFQGLFAQPIQIDGILEVDGELIDVSRWIDSPDGEVLFASLNFPVGNSGFTFNPSSGNLSIPGNFIASFGNATVNGILTDNYYYANGAPLDVGGNPAGSNTYVQFNNNNEFGASNNFTFDSSANLLSVTGNVSITQDLQLSSNSAISINNSVGNAGQVLTSNGTKTFWATNFYYGDTPPDFATLNYGDIFFFIDNPNNTQRLYMWVTDGSSDYFYDFLPPSF